LAGQRLPGRLVSIVDGAVQLPLGTLPLAAQAPGEGLPWGLLVQAPVDETALASTWKTVAEGFAAGASLVAITGGTAFTRRQISETVRIEHHGVSLLIEEGDDVDAALTAVLSGRTDLVASQNSVVTA
jgi:anthraniloyl-CoA monooxygenase